MKKNGQRSGFQTAAVIGLLAATAVMARPVAGRASREAVALDEVVLVSKRTCREAEGKKSDLPITGTFFGMLGGMFGQGEPPPEEPGVIISDALGDGGGDVEGVLFGVDLFGGLFFGEP